MAIQDVFLDNPAPAEPACPIEQLIDEMLDCYDEWRREVTAVEEAYRLWSAAPSSERDLYFGAYTATLDQEESAAMAYSVVFWELRESLQQVY